MAKITDYPKVEDLTDSNVFLLDGENGTKGIFAKQLADALLNRLTTKEIMSHINLNELDDSYGVDGSGRLLVQNSSGGVMSTIASRLLWSLFEYIPQLATKRCIYRGYNLGSVVTDDHYKEIRNGTFKNLFVGDYWRIGNINWRIMDINYWIYTGDNHPTTNNTNHLVIMPDNNLYSYAMNDTDTTAGGYVGSKMYQEGLNQAKTIINGAFGESHILNYRELLSNEVTNNEVSANAWSNCKIELPNEFMLLGTNVFNNVLTTSIHPLLEIVGNRQLAGFALYPHLLNIQFSSWWLRDIANKAEFSIISGQGHITAGAASKKYGVRPVFGLIG